MKIVKEISLTFDEERFIKESLCETIKRRKASGDLIDRLNDKFMLKGCVNY